MSARVPLCVVALLLAGPVAAGEKALEFACRSHPGFDSDQPLRIAHVRTTPAGRTYFHDDFENCPAAATCRRKAYLVPGDEVIVDRVAGDWACAWYAGRRKPSMGYLRAAELDLETKPRAPAVREWIGRWERIESSGNGPAATLEFSLLDDGLRVQGEAVWLGNFVDGAQVVHTGDIDVRSMDDTSDTTGFQPPDKYECAATFRRIGQYVVAEDNGACGGANVTFNGIYRREPKEEGVNDG